jgi:hypothetical protein
MFNDGNINEKREQTPKVLTQEFQDYGIWDFKLFKFLCCQMLLAMVNNVLWG